MGARGQRSGAGAGWVVEVSGVALGFKEKSGNVTVIWSYYAIVFIVNMSKLTKNRLSLHTSSIVIINRQIRKKRCGVSWRAT